ncbi:hypothetical protein IC620_13775 [Hazenella sp. IB182357]|uniref:Uncharacterized protein n=1 Tax=Polycladospora coralii TaxID=2771432 RepID=A0A926NH05_9BACL|nr:hypothetical protein [Polycladospora coralii]MBD1373419.1 hypothetical protein [Polycladospora coralii]
MEIKFWYDQYEQKLVVCHLKTGNYKEITNQAKMDTFLRAHAMTLEECQYPVETMDCIGLFQKKSTFQMIKEWMTHKNRSE